jgi:hypothetical protein
MPAPLLPTLLLLALAPQQSQSHSMDSTSTSPYKRTAVGDLDDDGLPDFVAVRDNKFTFVSALAAHSRATADLGSGVKDLALLSHTSSYARDTLVTVGTSGVQEWTNFENLDASSESAPIPSILTYSTAWTGAKKVTTRVFPSDTRPRVTGVMSDLRSVRVLRFNGTSWVDHELSFTVAIDEDIIDLAWVDYDREAPTPRPELTVLTTTKMRIYSVPLTLNTQGATTATHAITFATQTGWTEECMAAGAYPASHPSLALKEWVAVVVNHSNGVQQYLTVVDNTGPHGSTLLTTNPDVVAMDAAPYDGNDSMDLLLGNNATNTLWVLKNTSEAGTPAFTVNSQDPAKLEILTYESPVSGVQSNLAYPALADIDLDGDCDVLHAERWDSQLFIYRNPTANTTPTLATPDLEHLTTSTSIYVDENWVRNLSASVAIPTVWPSSATHLEIASFRKADSGSSNTERISAPSFRFARATYEGSPEMYVTLPLDDPALTYPDPDPCPAPPRNNGRFDNLYIYMLRFINVNPATGAVRWASGASFYGLEAQQGIDLPTPAPPVIEYPSDNENFLLGLMTSEEPGYVVFLCDPCDDCNQPLIPTGIGNEIGTIAPLPGLPNPASGPIVVTPPL